MDSHRFTRWSLQQEQMLESKQPAVRVLRRLLGRVLKMKITDGRVIMGSFLCVDKELNYVLNNSIEYTPSDVEKHGDDLKSAGPGRGLGIVIVPGKHITESFVVAEDGEKELQMTAPESTLIEESANIVGPESEEWYLPPSMRK